MLNTIALVKSIKWHFALGPVTRILIFPKNTFLGHDLLLKTSKAFSDNISSPICLRRFLQQRQFSDFNLLKSKF